MYYTQTIGGGYRCNPVAYKTLDEAKWEARRSSLDASEVRVYDCTGGPNGILIGRYCNGELAKPS